jgi:glycosyltransferase involved in cell wall biosynthesis
MTLLKAFAKLIKYRQAKLLLIGNGDDKDDLQKFIDKKKIDKLVKIIPYAKNPFKYVMTSDVKVLSSRFEGNPNILLEIACLKKLIISSDSKVGPREILQSGKGGFLFKVGGIDKLYYLLRNLNINSKNIKKKINTSYNYVIKNYQKDISIPFIKLIKNI